MKSLLKTHPVLKIVNSSLIDLPSPASISLWWNFGSILGLCLGVQLMTGLFLSMHYTSEITSAFFSVDHIMRDVNTGWALRVLHANGASLFFIALYLHAGRGMYYSSFFQHMTWGVGTMILLAVMAAAFMGYVLPWGQMSFWGATVITNLFSAIPYFGSDIVNWIWGGFAVDAATLTRFFALHFLVPFLVVAMAGIHLLFLHQTGSSNPLGLSHNNDKAPFHPYFSLKDTMGFFVALFVLIGVSFIYPWALGDPENFIPANPLVTPVHIQPEWYFLFAYAILRSIPNKLGGVVALVASVLVLLILPMFPQNKHSSTALYFPMKTMFWGVVAVFVLLTWIGARPVEEPYVLTGQVLTTVYFTYFLTLYWAKLLWDSL